MSDGEFYYGLGRRKTSSAQVRLYPVGEGSVVVNGKPMEEYFTRRRDRDAVLGPLNAAGLGGYSVTIVVIGGGVTGQSGAAMQGIARALVKANPELRGVLRRGGYLTRDPREKERKKPGLKRARKAPQYTKR
ncbi:MAG: 30S ribosomal protein S9 [Anaerolineae bacterium]|jgi:small subunit ribosomal protein S9